LHVVEKFSTESTVELLPVTCLATPAVSAVSYACVQAALLNDR